MNSKDNIKDWLPGLKENWRSDILSGFIVFLIALPLCLGISLASGAPPMAGIFSGIVGGIIVSLLSGSHLTINGPAAGLIAVVLNSIMVLGGGDPKLGFELTLAAIVIAGAIQVVLGLVKAGNLTVYFPISVVHGMMAAIGIIIISKQFYVALGITPKSKTIGGLLMEIPFSLSLVNPEVAIIGISAILIIAILAKIKNPLLKKLPAPLVAVLVGIVLGIVFDLADEHSYTLLDQTYKIGPEKLVNLPDHIYDGITFPDFSRWKDGIFWVMVVTIALIASIESLLTATAVDNTDPYRRKSNMDRELVAKGAGNFFLGWIGGLPIISEVVRSSANIENGAKTRFSNFFHGLFLLFFILLLPGLIHRIPLASLAGILIMVGVRLASPHVFKETYEKGWDQIVIFIVTVILTIVEDLLVGVLCGIITAILIQIYFGVPLRYIFVADITIKSENKVHELYVRQALLFSNMISLKLLFRKIAPGERVDLKFDQNVKMIGFSAIEFLQSFKRDYESRGGQVNLIGFEDLKPISAYYGATRIHK
ncbi:SulP family inorganic anion transporter [Leptospira noumeaensis]|uniref:SulP family inorganic anion transporter n=1 Tax=Leptospira noumeaensis TaxID=2484964 RepID=A0A4R9I7V0_9LEPT|nr:SulP family inorganic anion transporter [Leptospira noumeaensis]TGK81479.1 SulP family inorganic anion transporter [Leptospira noumeaensis]